MKPFWKFWHLRLYDYRTTRDYKNGIRKVIALEYEKPCGSLLTDDFKWVCPTVQFHLIIGWFNFAGWFPLGRIKLSGWDPVEDRKERRERRPEDFDAFQL